jgi:hypothetical protein
VLAVPLGQTNALADAVAQVIQLGTRDLPLRIGRISTIFGEFSGNVRSTPSSPIIRRTVNIRSSAAFSADHCTGEYLSASLFTF